ncbi:MAG TPA: DUF2304 family protein [Acidimicrobiales bacterium]|nr:DUF2304 family protein [Acidimicrobiales bacterium]
MSLSLLSVVLGVKAFVLSMALSATFLVVSIFAMRRQRLREHTALLWLLVSVVMVLVSVSLRTGLLTRISDLVGIAYSPAFVLLLAVLFLLVLVFQLSLSVDRLSARQTALVQEIGLLTAMSPTSPDEDGEGGATGEDIETPQGPGDQTPRMQGPKVQGH